MRRWGPTAVVLVLLAGTALAFATTERQKLEKTPFDLLAVGRTLSPTCGCATSASTIALRFRRRHVLTLQILDAHGRIVDTLARERTVRGTVDIRWNGSTRAGGRAPDGVYRPKIVLDNDRTFDVPTVIRLDTHPPSISLVSYRPHVLRRRTKDRVQVRYRVAEPAHPILYVNGRRDILGGGKALVGKFDWFARRGGQRLGRGRYRLQLAAVDLAGNVGPRTRPFVVRIR